MASNILVMGAGGAIGNELILRLAHIGSTVRAALHDRSNVPERFQYDNVEKVSFNFDDSASIRQAFDSSIKELFLLTPDTPDMVHYVKVALQCAKEVGVSYVVRVSLLGVGREPQSRLAQWHLQAESVVRDSGIPFTILRPNCLMQHFFHFIKPETGVIYLPMGEASVSFIDARDVAIVAADLLLPGDHHYGKTYELTGSESYSMHQVAEIISRVIGQKVGYVDIPDGTARYTLENMIPESRIDAVLEYFHFLKQNRAAFVNSSVEQIAGKEPVSFVDFSRDYAQTIRNLVVHHV